MAESANPDPSNNYKQVDINKTPFGKHKAQSPALSLTPIIIIVKKKQYLWYDLIFCKIRTRNFKTLRLIFNASF